MTLLSPSQARIKTLDDRLARLRAERIRLAEQANLAERKRDTRRKILIGGAVLAAVERDGVPPLNSEQDLSRWMDAHLTRAHDRAVFDLPTTAPPTPKSTKATTASAEQTPDASPDLREDHP